MNCGLRLEILCDADSRLGLVVLVAKTGSLLTPTPEGGDIRGACCGCCASDPVPSAQPLVPSIAGWVLQKQTLTLSLECKIFIRDKHL